MERTVTEQHTHNSLVALLGLGPVITVAGIAAGAGTTYLPAEYAPLAAIVALLIWAPTPVSIPGLLFQDLRDNYRPDLRGLPRAGRLLRHLVRLGGTVGRATTANLVGVVIAAIAAIGWF